MDTTIATSAQTAACTHCHTKNGRDVARHSGVMEPARLLSWVRAHA